MMMINHHDLLPVVYNLEKDKGLEQHSLYKSIQSQFFYTKDATLFEAVYSDCKGREIKYCYGQMFTKAGRKERA